MHQGKVSLFCIMVIVMPRWSWTWRVVDGHGDAVLVMVIVMVCNGHGDVVLVMIMVMAMVALISSFGRPKVCYEGDSQSRWRGRVEDTMHEDAGMESTWKETITSLVSIRLQIYLFVDWLVDAEHHTPSLPRAMLLSHSIVMSYEAYLLVSQSHPPRQRVGAHIGGMLLLLVSHVCMHDLPMLAPISIPNCVVLVLLYMLRKCLFSKPWSLHILHSKCILIICKASHR